LDDSPRVEGWGESEVVGVLGMQMRASRRSAPAGGGGILEDVNAKEQLLKEAPRWSEHEAEVALRAVERESDLVARRLDDASFEDEEISAEEEAAVQEARDELAAGEPTIPLAEIKRKYGLR
jgi:hypothetical protein